MGSVQTLKYDHAGFTSEIFGVSHVDSVSYFLPFAPLSPPQDRGDNNLLLGVISPQCQIYGTFSDSWLGSFI